MLLVVKLVDRSLVHTRHDESCESFDYLAYAVV